MPRIAEETERSLNSDLIKEELRTRFDTALLDINNDADDMSDQRDKANEDLRFLSVTGGMWEDWQGQNWQNRSRLEFDTTSDYVNLYLGQWSTSRRDVLFERDDKATTDDDAELLNRAYRANFRDESGKVALDQAVFEQVICGYGCLKIGTRFVDDEDPSNDMMITDFRPIYNAFNMVFWDRAARRPDKRDARRCTLLEPYTRDSWEDTFPGIEPNSAFNPHTKSYNDFNLRTKELFYAATRYDVVRKKTIFHVYANLKTNEVESYSDEDHKDLKRELEASKFHKKIRTREIMEQYVEKSVLSGTQYIEEPIRIAGKWIPIIPFYGYRTYVDGIERYHGLVRKLKDPQRLFNMQMSQLAENSASSGQDVPIFDPDQMPPEIDALWAERNNKPYMLAKALIDPISGEVIQHGPLGYLKAPQIDGSSAALLEIVPKFIQQATGGAPQETANPDASGKAIIALQQRQDMKTQTLRDNANSSIEWMGTVWKDMFLDIVNEQRVVRTMDLDGTAGQVELQKEVMNKETGRMERINNLSGKKFRAITGTGPQYETIREQTNEDIKGMMELLIKIGAAGEKYIPMLIAISLDNMPTVGLGEFKEIVRQDLIAQGLRKPQTDEEKALIEKLQQDSQTPSKQDQLMQAMADQAQSEGDKFKSEARNLDSKSVQNIADARKKAAETRKILMESGLTRENVLKELLSTTLKRAEKLPFPEQQQSGGLV